MSEKHDANNPYITIGKNANPKAISVVFYGTTLLVLILALPFPFFRHVFTFGSIIMTGLCFAGAVMAHLDKENGVVRLRPKKKGFVFPKWFKPAFFLSVIGISAGLRLGWYLIPLCWVINWACIYSSGKHIDATYKEKDPIDADRYFNKYSKGKDHV